MLTTLVRWFGAGQARPARRSQGLRFGLRLETLEGRATPGAIGFDHIGEEIPQTGGDLVAYGGSKPGVVSGSNDMPLGGDTGTQVFAVGIDPSSIKAGGSDFGVGIDPSASKPNSGGEI